MTRDSLTGTRPSKELISVRRPRHLKVILKLIQGPRTILSNKTFAHTCAHALDEHSQPLCSQMKSQSLTEESKIVLHYFLEMIKEQKKSFSDVN